MSAEERYHHMSYIMDMGSVMAADMSASLKLLVSSVELAEVSGVL